MMLDVLKRLALLGGLKGFVSVSSGELAVMLNISQQSASKKILELINNGMIERNFGHKRQLIKITKKGLNLLQKEYADYQRILEEMKKISLKGVVTSGMGEGRYYLSIRGYREQFKRKLGFNPYNGTLNLKIIEPNKIGILKESDGAKIDGFQDGERTFGAGKCFPAKIRNTNCAVIIPERSHYSDIIEVISTYYLREKLKIRDGDEVEVEVKL